MAKGTKLKAGLRHPRRAFNYLVHGEQKYYLRWAEKMEHRIKPKSHLEAHMVKPTDVHEHLATLNMLTIELGLKTVLELGTGIGETTVAFLEAAKELDGKVYSIDIDPCQEAHSVIKNYGLEKYWTFIQADSLKIKWDRPIDHLYIDTVHTFQQAAKELKKYEPCVRRGGLITLHDIVTWPGVMRAVNHYTRNRPDLRPYRYFNNNGLTVIFKGRRR